jgi:hypothetical protein
LVRKTDRADALKFYHCHDLFADVNVLRQRQGDDEISCDWSVHVEGVRLLTALQPLPGHDVFGSSGPESKDSVAVKQECEERRQMQGFPP